MSSPHRRYAYLHGFASGPRSRKGVHLAERMAERGIELRLPDLNRPSFSKLSVSGALEAVDAMVAALSPASSGRRWRFVGSSFGGYVASRWAELHPDRIDRLLLLCPAFDLIGRWPAMMGADAIARWGRDGAFGFPDLDGVPTPVHWGFAEDLRLHPPEPEVPCETRIIHGVRDEVVPIEGSRAYAASRPNVELIEVDDDHSLLGSLATIESEIAGFLVA